VRLARGQKFLYQTIQSFVRKESAQASFFGTKKILHSANLQATIQAAGFLQVLPKSSFKELLLGTKLWQHAKMSTSLKSPDGLKDAECKKGQLSHWPPIPYVLVVDIVTPKKEPQIFNSLSAMDGHDLPLKNWLRSTVVSCRIFIPSRSLIAC
jgi:hypothetical protein